jgi:hypothetical protein
MAFESIMTLVPAVALVAVAAATVAVGYVIASCTKARIQGKECPSE